MKYWALWCTLSIVLTTNESKKIFPFSKLFKEVGKSWPHCRQVCHIGTGTVNMTGGGAKIAIYSLVLSLHGKHTKTNLQTLARFCCCGEQTPLAWHGMAGGRANFLYTSCANCSTQNITLAHQQLVRYLCCHYWVSCQQLIMTDLPLLY